MSAVHVEIPHSPLGPSSSERWLNCPGSVLATKDMEDPDSWYAAEGTAAHTLSEWCRNEQRDAEHWRGTVLKVGKFEFTVDQEMIDGVNDFCEYVEKFDGDAFYELRVHYDEWVPSGFGTSDDARLTDGLCRVTDLKYGKGVEVAAADNSQLKLYALGLYHDLRYLYEFDRFELHVVQPRLNIVDVDDTLTLPRLLEWANDVVRPTAEIALKPGAPFKAGDWCQFCPAKRVCKVRAEHVAQTVCKSDFTNLDAPLALEFMTNEEVGLILPKLDGIKAWCKDVEAHAYSEIAKGNRIPHPEFGDYKLVEGRSNRIYNKSDEEVAATLEFEVDDPDVLWKPRDLKGPAQIEKIIGKKRLAELDIVYKPPGRPKLVPGTDKREPMTIDPTAEFGSLED